MNDKGITLVALIITVVILIIIVGVTVGVSNDSISETKLKGFYTQLEVIQKRIDSISATNEYYVESDGSKVYLKQQGVPYTELATDKQNKLQEILEQEEIEIEIENFRYLTSTELINILDTPEVDYNVYIDFENRIVISEEGVTVGDKTYYMLETTVYFVNQNTNKNVGSIEFLTYTITTYGEDKYKITITPSNTIGDMNIGGVVKYKKSRSQYWESSSKLEIIVDELTEYDIIYEDANKNTVTEKIKLELNSSSQLVVTKM